MAVLRLPEQDMQNVHSILARCPGLEWLVERVEQSLRDDVPENVLELGTVFRTRIELGAGIGAVEGPMRVGAMNWGQNADLHDVLDNPFGRVQVTLEHSGPMRHVVLDGG